MKNAFVIIAMTLQGFLSQVIAQTDVTTPGDPIIGGQMIGGVFDVATQGTPAGNANMFPSNGLPAFAIDNNLASKYRNFGETNTGFIVTPSFNHNVGGTSVTRLDIVTASDAPERDPLTFTLEGTNGDPLTGTYTLIASGSTSLETDPGRSVGVTILPVIINCEAATRWESQIVMTGSIAAASRLWGLSPATG